MLGSGTKSMRTERHISKLISPMAQGPQHRDPRSVARVLDEAIAASDCSPTGLSTSKPLCLDTFHTSASTRIHCTHTHRAAHTYQH